MINASTMNNQRETQFLIDDLEFKSESHFVIIDEIDRLLNTLYDQESDSNFVFHPDYFDLVVETVNSLIHDYRTICLTPDQEQDPYFVLPNPISSVNEIVDGAFEKRFTGLNKLFETALSIQEDLDDGLIDEDQIPYEYQGKLLALHHDLRNMERIMYGDNEFEIDDFDHLFGID